MGGEGMEEKERRTGRAGKRSVGGGCGKQMQATCYRGACPHRCAVTPLLSNEVFEGGWRACSSLLLPEPSPPRGLNVPVLLRCMPSPLPRSSRLHSHPHNPQTHRGNLGFRVRGQCTKRTKKRMMKKKKKEGQQQGHETLRRRHQHQRQHHRRGASISAFDLVRAQAKSSLLSSLLALYVHPSCLTPILPSFLPPSLPPSTLSFLRRPRCCCLFPSSPSLLLASSDPHQGHER
jgi:hypothetical protein